MAQDQNEQQNQVQNSAIPASPVSSGNPETGPIVEVGEKKIADYSSFPQAPSDTPVLQPSPAIKIADDIASQPSLQSMRGNVINISEAREKFKKGDIHETGTWESGVIVLETDREKQKKAA